VYYILVILQSSDVVEREEEITKAITSAKLSGMFPEKSAEEDNNKSALHLLEGLGCDGLLVSYSLLPHDYTDGLPTAVFTSQQDINSQEHRLFHCLVSVTSPHTLTVELNGRKFILLPQSRFLMSDIMGLNIYSNSLAAGEGFHFIVMDPPWQNKSIKRKRM